MREIHSCKTKLLLHPPTSLISIHSCLTKLWKLSVWEKGGGAQPYSIAFWGVSCNNVEYITTYIDLIRLAFSDFVCCVQMITRMGTAIGQGGKEQSERKGD